MTMESFGYIIYKRFLLSHCIENVTKGEVPFAHFTTSILKTALWRCICCIYQYVIQKHCDVMKRCLIWFLKIN